MRLNGIKLAGHFSDEGRLCFELECGFDEASALDGQVLTVTDDGDTVEEHFGYTLSSISKSGETLFVWFDRAIPDSTKDAISKLEESVNAVHGDVSAVKQAAADASAKAVDAGDKADEAKQAADSVGAALDALLGIVPEGAQESTASEED